MVRFQFFRLTDRQTDGQNRLLNPASRMRARGNYNGSMAASLKVHTVQYV